jgi:DNA-binding GntR family transcriptional regulator
MGWEYDNSLPLYDQVRLRILSDLRSGRFAAGSYLPAEAQLCEAYGVSRITLRRAVSDLCGDGLLKKVHGRGTLVTAPKLQQALVSLGGFTETLHEQGIKSRFRVIDIAAAASEEELHRRLSGAAGETVLAIRRILFANERPLTLETLFLLEQRYGRVVSTVGEGGSFYGALRDLYGEVPQAAERTINVSFPSVDEAERLEASPSQPVFRIEKTVFGTDGRPIALSRLTTPVDRVTYTIRS